MTNISRYRIFLVPAFLFALLTVSALRAVPMNAKVSASSVEGKKSDLLPSNIVDGDLLSRWASEFSDPQWVKIDLLRTKTVYALQIVWESAFAKEYSVSLSTNGKKWEKVFQTSAGKEGPEMIRFKGPTPVRYVRIDMTARGTEWGNSLYEVQFQFEKDKPIEDPAVAAKKRAYELSRRKWKLVWKDEFDGATVDGSKWNFVVSGGGFGNGEKQYYTDRPQNIFVKDGFLHLKAVKENYSGEEYTSAKIFTENKGDWLYGRFEMRGKMPVGRGIWPAFWMMPTGYSKNYGPWPLCGEIDIMEYLGHDPSTVYGTLHFGNPHEMPNGAYRLPDGKRFDQDFHVFTVEWDPDEFRWYCDGILYSTKRQWFTSAPGALFPAPFDQKFFLQLNLAVGGAWPGYPDSTTVFPQEMIVDYVRVYQLDGAYPPVERRPFGSSSGVRPPQADGNMIYNGGFDSGTDEWELALDGGGDGDISVSDSVLNAIVKNPGNQDWSVQLRQGPLLIEQDKHYILTFEARAEKPRTIVLSVNQSKEPWTSHSGRRTLQLTAKKTNYTVTFRMRSPTDAEARLEFNMGGAAAGVFIDKVDFRIDPNPPETAVPIKGITLMEAEAFDKMQGINTEDCSEGTKNIGWVETGDWMEYRIDVPESGIYQMEFRVASAKDTGAFDLLVDGQKAAAVQVGSTGDWQSWVSMKASVRLAKGIRTIRILATGPEFNLNWIKIRVVDQKKRKK